MGKEKSWLPAVYPFPTKFSKAFLCKVVKLNDHSSNGLTSLKRYVHNT